MDVVPSNTINNITHMLMGNGHPLQEAQTMAYKIMDLSVLKQTMLLGYLDSFSVVGAACLVVLPLLFLIKHNKKKEGETSINMH